MTRPLRADAQRNRDRLLAVAEEIFATRGVTASTEEIARQAGVGIGTLFRHFPTKEDLLKAVFVGRMQRLARSAEALADAADPGAALFHFFTTVVDQAATKNALVDALTESGLAITEAAAPAGLRDALSTLLRRAQDAGTVRPDLGVPELIGLLVGASRGVEQVGEDRQARRRIIAVILDGLRPDPRGSRVGSPDRQGTQGRKRSNSD